jgi:pyridoxal biosynthesis lyase PdxS
MVDVSMGLDSAMKGIDMSEIPEGERLQERGW